MNKKALTDLLEVLKKASRDEKLLNAFLADILTPKEYEEVIMRWQIVKQLHEGVSQRDIAKNLKIGIGTVTRGAKELQDKNGGFAKILK